MIPFLVSTTGGLGLFLFLVRRRSPSDQPAHATVLAADAAVSANAVPSLFPPPLDPELLRVADDVPGPRPDEIGIPRWLRPSVREARFRSSRSAPYDGWD
jgi:hypothetical protein